jgi:hypothetical protein
MDVNNRSLTVTAQFPFRDEWRVSKRYADARGTLTV